MSDAFRRKKDLVSFFVWGVPTREELHAVFAREGTVAAEPKSCNSFVGQISTSGSF